MSIASSLAFSGAPYESHLSQVERAVAQTRFFDFGETLTSSSFSVISRDLLLPGIYRGFGVNVLSPSAFELSPGVLLLPNGVYVVEDAPQRFVLDMPVTGSVNYFLVCRHRVRNMVGGIPAEFVICRGTAANDASVSMNGNSVTCPSGNFSNVDVGSLFRIVSGANAGMYVIKQVSSLSTIVVRNLDGTEVAWVTSKTDQPWQLISPTTRDDSSWSYIVVAELHDVTPVTVDGSGNKHGGLLNATISVPMNVRQNMLNILNGADKVQEQLFPAPFVAGVVLVVPGYTRPIPQESLRPYDQLTGLLSMQTISSIEHKKDGFTYVTFEQEAVNGVVDGDFCAIVGVREHNAFNGVFGPVRTIGSTVVFPQKPKVGDTPFTDALGNSIVGHSGFLYPNPFGRLFRWGDEDSAPLNTSQLRFYQIPVATIGIHGFIPNGLLIDQVTVIARKGTHPSSPSDMPGTIVFTLYDSTGKTIPFIGGQIRSVYEDGDGSGQALGTVNVKPMVIAQTTFTQRLSVSIETSEATLPAHGEYFLQLEMNNVDIAGVIVSYKGTAPYLINTEILSSTGIIYQKVISP